MGRLVNLTFKTKTKAPGSGVQYFTQCWVKNDVNLNTFCTALNALLANHAHVQASEVKVRPSDQDIELPANYTPVNENEIRLGWRGESDPTIFTSVRIPCLRQDVTVDALNTLLTGSLCAATSDGAVSGADVAIDPNFTYQNSKAVTLVQTAQG
jgi:hypothetical protein